MRRLTPPNSTPMRFSATTVIACLALALSGCAVGILLGRWTAAPQPLGGRDLEPADPQPDIRPALEDLRRTNEALLQAIRERHDNQLPSGTARETAVPAPESLDRLTAAVEKLNGLFARGVVGAGAGSTPTDAVKGSGFPSLNALWQDVDSVAVLADPDWQSKLDTELTRAHLLWTNEDLVQRYGACSSMSLGNVLGLTYSRPQEADRANDVIFRLSNGRILNVVAR